MYSSHRQVCPRRLPARKHSEQRRRSSPVPLFSMERASWHRASGSLQDGLSLLSLQIFRKTICSMLFLRAFTAATIQSFATTKGSRPRTESSESLQSTGCGSFHAGSRSIGRHIRGIRTCHPPHLFLTTLRKTVICPCMSLDVSCPHAIPPRCHLECRMQETAPRFRLERY